MVEGLDLTNKRVKVVRTCWKLLKMSLFISLLRYLSYAEVKNVIKKVPHRARFWAIALQKKNFLFFLCIVLGWISKKLQFTENPLTTHICFFHNITLTKLYFLKQFFKMGVTVLVFTQIPIFWPKKCNSREITHFNFY